jgi:hypothetical protein
VAALKPVETTAWIVGVLMVIGCWFAGSQSMALGAAMGALFASINFRLLIWSWTAYVDTQVKASQEADEASEPEEASVEAAEAALGVLPKFLIKYAFLILGVFVLIGGLRLHFVGCLIGMGNVIVAATLSPIVLKLGRSQASAKSEASHPSS